MTIIELIILGLALSMDAFAVTLCNLMSYPHLSRAKRTAMAFTFAVFQGAMPLLGYFLGSLAAQAIDSIAGPLALVLLGLIGGKMIYEGVRALHASKQQEQTNSSSVPQSQIESPSCKQDKTLTASAIVLQGVATSLDALIVGISLLALGVNIVLASALIAATTLICCIVALIVGKRLGVLLGDRAQVIGGIVLILIGIKACFF